MSTPQEQNNRRQLEKERRKKTFEDSQVQGTNNSSIVSKRSVELIYNSLLPGEWFKYFVPGKKRRSPAINRGYYLRMECIRQTILKIKANTAEPINIINLGCGFDVLAYQLWDQDFTFYDIDYPELIQRKLSVINKTEQIKTLVGPDDGSRENGLVYNSDRYKLVGCDLKDYDLYEKILTRAKPGVNIFVAEVSLAYMDYKDANRIIEISSKSNSHFIILEQILPAGKYHSFAQKMLKHFNKLRSSLKCVEQYPTKQHQVDRFKQFYSNVEVNDLFENWHQLIDDKTRHALDKLEQFDEWEEFIVFCQHYVVVHATTNQLVYRENPADVTVDQEDEVLTVSPFEYPLTLKYPAACEYNDQILVHGGMDQTREAKGYVYGSQLTEVGGPSARMCHSLTAVDGAGILIGGRTSPGTILSDVWKYDGQWTRLQDIAHPVYRHRAVYLGEQRILVVGARWLIYDVSTQTTTELAVPSRYARLMSCGLQFDAATQTGHFVGGMTDPVAPTVSETLCQFSINYDQKTVEVTEVLAQKILQRIDAHLAQYQGRLVVAGGVCFGQVLDRSSTIVSISGNQINTVSFSPEHWEKTPPTPIGMTLTGPAPTLTNGGAVWYSFGTAFNNSFIVGCKKR